MENNNIKVENNNKKFYILNNSGEMEAYSIVELTGEEYAVLKKIFKESYDNTVSFDDYSPSLGLFDIGFDTKEEAITYINEIDHPYTHLSVDEYKKRMSQKLYFMDDSVRERDY